jgi:enoyl-CoA hydratase/carnithine racemase
MSAGQPLLLEEEAQAAPLRVSVADGIATVALDRPPGNELNAASIDRLIRTLACLEEDRGTRAIVITSALRYAFCAGSDLQSLFGTMTPQMVSPERLGHADDMQIAFRRIEDCTKPVIAAINGIAAGAGLELALVCDLRVSSELADFMLPELEEHLIPGLGATQRLARVVGLGRAKELLMLGRRLKAREALAWGLVNHVVPHRQTLAQALEVARELAAKPPEAFAALKRSIHRGLDASRDAALHYETREFHWLLSRRPVGNA